MSKGDNYLVKMILLGDTGVGKTSLRRQYLGEGFSKSYQKTIGVDISHLKIENPDGVKFTIGIWDLSGDSPFSVLRTTYFANALAVCFVFDLTRKVDEQSFEQWYEDLAGSETTYSNFVLAVIGNKKDLKKQLIQSEETLRPYIEKLKNIPNIGAVKYFETSAKFGDGINELLQWQVGHIKEIIDKRTKIISEITDVNRYPFAFFIMSKTGPKIHTYSFPGFEHPERLADYLMNLSISYISALGQGHAYSEGVYQLPPGEIEGFSTIAISKKIVKEGIPEGRDNQNYGIFTIFIPEEFEPYFSLDQRKKRKIFKLFEDMTELGEVTVTNLEEIRDDIVQILVRGAQL